MATRWRFDYLYCDDRMADKDAYPMVFIGTQEEWDFYVKEEQFLFGFSPISVKRRRATKADFVEAKADNARYLKAILDKEVKL